MLFYHCESEAGSSCSTPFVSAPSSPSRSSTGTATSLKNTAKNTGTTSKNSLYYYFSAPSSPPRDHKHLAAANPEHHHQRGFSFTECEFQFHSRFDGAGGGGSGGSVVAALPTVLGGERRRQEEEEEEEAMIMEDAEMGGVSGFYFSAPTSPDRRNKDRSGKGGGIWDEMPGTPKMIFGGGANAGTSLDPSPSLGFFNADSDFEFSSSRMSDSDSTISAQMSSADELFFKGQLLPMKIPPPQLTSSDSSGSSNTIASTDSSSASSSSAAAAPASPRSARKAGGSASPGRMKMKSAVMGSLCGAAMIKSGSISDSSISGSGTSAPTSGSRGPPRSLSPLQLLKKYQSMMLMMGRPASSNSSSSPSLAASSSSSSSSADHQIPRPARTSSKGRTLRELLHLSSMHKKNKPGASSSKAAGDKKTIQAEESTPTPKEAKDSPPTPPPPPLTVPPPSKPLAKKLDSSALSKRLVEKSLGADHSKRFTAATARKATTTSSSSAGLGNLQGIAIPKKKFHSLDLHHGGGSSGGYYSSTRRLHSGSIVPEAEFPAMAARPHKGRQPDATSKNKRLNYHVAHYRRGHGGRGGPMFHSGPIMGGKVGGGGGDFQSARFTDAGSLNLNPNHSKGGGGDQFYYYSNSAASSACSSRNVSPRRSRNNSINSSNSGNILGAASVSSSSAAAAAAVALGGGSGISLHELHYKSQQRVNSEEMRRKTFLPYKQGLLGCLGCATMRIAGLSKSLQPMASSR